MKTILIVEDERAIAALVRDYLERSGFRSVIAATAASARERLESDRPELVVLDLGLPDSDGLDILRHMRQRGETPVIVLTARGDEVDRIVGLDLGADDYVVKPFSPGELVARIRAVLRRWESSALPRETLQVGALTIDVPRMLVSRGDAPIDLTATEFQILVTLAREPGRVFTRGQLLSAVHGVLVESYERAIDAHVKNIRRKLESDDDCVQYIQTVHGVGYRFVDA